MDILGGRSLVHCREVVSLSQRLLMYNGHTGGSRSLIHCREVVSLSQRLFQSVNQSVQYQGLQLYYRLWSIHYQRLSEIIAFRVSIIKGYRLQSVHYQRIMTVHYQVQPKSVHYIVFIKSIHYQRLNSFLSSRSRRNCPKPLAVNGEEEEAKMLHANLPLMEIHGAIEFKMDKKSYRMIPLANSEDYLYNKGTLKRAKQVSSLTERL